MKNRNVFLYIAGACFFAMCGSLWNEYFGSHNSHLNLETLNPVLRASDGAERSERNPESLNPGSQKAPGRYYAVARPAVESFPFDPNEADSTQLLRLGLTPAQVRSIYRHRAKGYVYSSPEDFARTPFMTKGQWNHLKPLIKIGDQYRLLNANVNDNIRPRRFCPPITGEPKGVQRPLTPQQARLIEAEPSRMSMERSYMNRSSLTDNRAPITDTLGAQPRTVNSQHSNKPNAEKLAYSAEARRMSMDEIHELSPVNLNESSFKDLVHHPFLSYEQVKAVKNFQRKYGRIRNMTELLILPEFTVEDTLRLSPYLQF